MSKYSPTIKKNKGLVEYALGRRKNYLQPYPFFNFVHCRFLRLSITYYFIIYLFCHLIIDQLFLGSINTFDFYKIILQLISEQISLTLKLSIFFSIFLDFSGYVRVYCCV